MLLKHKLAPFPFQNHLSEAVQISSAEFVVAMKYESPQQSERYGLYKYNTIQNKWKLFLKYPKKLSSFRQHTLSFDKNNNKLYLSNSRGQITKIDINNHQYHFSNTSHKKRVKIGANSSSIAVDGLVHIIGGNNSTKHLIWEHKTKTFREKDLEKYIHGGLPGSGLVYIPSKQILLLFNGYLNKILLYSFKKNGWRALQIQWPMEMKHFSQISANLTVNERYVILLSSGIRSCNSNIYVVDLEKMMIKKSTIKCPLSGGTLTAVLMHNQEMNSILLVYGLFNSIFGKTDLILPHDIIQLMISFFFIEGIHVLHREKGTHWKISVDAIISNI